MELTFNKAQLFIIRLALVIFGLAVVDIAWGITFGWTISWFFGNIFEQLMGIYFNGE